MNTLYYGDNLDVMRRYIKDESINLVYLDPPFNSDADYNVLFQEQSGKLPAAQVRAFEDTWRWDQVAAMAFEESVESGGHVADALIAFRTFLGPSNMLAYLAMMAPRLIEIRRVLKEDGSIWLHCDPTASHYLKQLMDAIFDPTRFRNEVVWARTGAKSHMTQRLPSNHDVLLSYRKGEVAKWNLDNAFIPYKHDDLDDKTLSQYSHLDSEGRRYQLDNLTNPNHNRPNLTYEFLGVRRVWRWTEERMQEAFLAGKIYQSSPGTVPRLIRYLDEQRGRPISDVWTDVPPLSSHAAERLGYPTQKPLALLERIIGLCTDVGDTVLDPFCGCGTTVDAAQKLGRQWIGIDITHLAIGLIRHRLRGAGIQLSDYKVIGEPTDLSGAKELAETDPYQFQWWALGLLGARPTEQKKGADRGIDGRLYFHDDSDGDTKQVIFSVKAGKVQSSYVRDLVGVINRENAEIGVLVSLNHSTQEMRTEAAAAGFYESGWNTRHTRIQLITIEEILAGKTLDLPLHRNRTLKKSDRSGTLGSARRGKRAAEALPDSLFDDGVGEEV